MSYSYIYSNLAGNIDITPLSGNDCNVTVSGNGSFNTVQTSTGGSSEPAVIIQNNDGGANPVYMQLYKNSSTPAVNDGIGSISFQGNSSTGVKREWARISAVAENISSNRGQLDLAVAGSGGTISTYLSLSGNNNYINANRNIDMNNNNITSCSTIETDITNYYGKQITPVFLTAHSPISTNVENYVRYNAWNAGRTATWEQATSVNDFTGYVENITASQYGFNSAWWVGTSAGNVYYSIDSGDTWNFVYNFGGRINCFQTYNGGNDMMVGGQFTGTYNYIATINSSGLGISDPTGYGGLNNNVYCFYENTFNSVLYIGGDFDALYGFSGTSYKFFTYDWNSTIFYPFNNYSSAGFTGGAVRSITYDNSSGTNSFVIVGGDFTDENTSGSSCGIPYLFTFETSNGYSVSSFFGIGLALNSPVSSVLSYTSGGVLVGGQFNNTAGTGSCNTNYGILITWSGSSWNITDYPIYSPSNIITSITYIATTGIYYTIESGNLIRSGSTQLPAIPIGSSWDCIAYNGSSTYFATNAQTTAGFLFYQLNNSLAIILSGGLYNINAYSGNYTTIQLLQFGSSVELMYYNSVWWVVAQNGCNFS